MHGRGCLLADQLLVLVWQVYIKVDEVIELVQVTEALIAHLYLFQYEVFRPGNLILDLTVIMLRPYLSELTHRYAILRIQIPRVKQHVLEGDQHAEIQPFSVPLFQPISS